MPFSPVIGLAASPRRGGVPRPPETVVAVLPGRARRGPRPPVRFPLGTAPYRFGGCTMHPPKPQVNREVGYAQGSPQGFFVVHRTGGGSPHRNAQERPARASCRTEHPFVQWRPE